MPIEGQRNTAELIESITFEHEPDRTEHEIDCEGGTACCQCCEQSWPCDAILLVRSLSD